jgi:N-acetylmuramoyl-L-alanine amidase/LysM repeat protein
MRRVMKTLKVTSLVLFCFVLVHAAQTAPTEALKGIRVGDYTTYSHISIEARATTSVVTPISKRSNYLQVTLYGIAESNIGTMMQPESQAIGRVSIQTDSSTSTTFITIPLNANVDVRRILWHQWENFITIDLPYLHANNTIFPSAQEIDQFRRRGGKVVIIDAGHGGLDPGALGYRYARSGRLVEKDMTLDLARRLKQLIDANPNLMGILTRNGDYLPVPFGVKGYTAKNYVDASLEYRVELAKRFQGDIFVSLHCNSAASSKARGFEIFYFGEDHAARFLEDTNLDLEALASLDGNKTGGSSSMASVLKQLNIDHVPQHSRSLANLITNEMSKIRGISLRDPAVKSFRFKVIKQLNMPSVLTEFLFLSNPEEQEFMRQSTNRDRMSQALYNAICSYFQVSSKPALKPPVLIAKQNAPVPQQRITANTGKPSPSKFKEPNRANEYLQNTLAQLESRKPAAPDPIEIITDDDPLIPLTEDQIQGPVTPITTRTIIATTPARQEPQPIRTIEPSQSEPVQISSPSSKVESVKALPKVEPQQVEPKVETVPKLHKVKSGDTLIAIANHYKISLDDLRAMNRDTLGKRDRIMIGQELVVGETIKSAPQSEPPKIAKAEPKSETPASTQSVKSDSSTDRKENRGNSRNSSSYKTHKITSGESLSSIAQKYKISVDELRMLNRDIIGRRDRITAGQELRIPEGSTIQDLPRYITYKVQKNDTLGKIASRFNTTVESIQKTNALKNSTVIKPGDELKIASAEPSDKLASAKPLTYEIQPGDTLSAIADRFQVSVAQLKSANNIQRVKSLQVGQTIQIP